MSRMIATGGDYYPRFGPTMEWYTAAGDALLPAWYDLSRCLSALGLMH